jgi:hypothetical protein
MLFHTEAQGGGRWILVRLLLFGDIRRVYLEADAKRGEQFAAAW